MRNSHSAYLFTFINILEQVTRFIFNYHQIDYFIVNNNNYYSYEKYTVENDYKNIVGSRINVLISSMFLYPVFLSLVSTVNAKFGISILVYLY